MKTKGLICFLAYVIFLVINLNSVKQAFCQKIETLKTFTLPEEATNGTLVSFLNVESSGNYQITYSIGKKKQALFVSYIFDKDFNYIKTESPTEMEVAKAQEMYPFYDFEKNEVKDMGSILIKNRKVTVGEINTNDNSNTTYTYSISKENFTLKKIKNGTLESEKTIPFSEFEAKFKYPPSGEKGKPCSNKSNKFIIVGHFIGTDGSIFILGQNKDKGGVIGAMEWKETGQTDTKYRDCFILHFDDQGNLLSQYSYDLKTMLNKSPCEQYLIEGASGKTTYWMILNNFIGEFPAGGFYYIKPYICQIDLNNNTMGKVFNGQKELAVKEFKYLDTSFPFLNPQKGSLILLGRDRVNGPGKVISFVRMTLE